MNAKDFSEAEIIQHLKDGGSLSCSIRLASGNDFTISINSLEDYEVIKEDIIPEYEMVLFIEERK
ncbi:MAG: hypothetical protein IJF92_00385 [Bacilli bacterium]|nr:hypothetical protein [Bacilli bacterium]MBQ3307555.1 hypothetical protein [Bacilli bacterium]